MQASGDTYRLYREAFFLYMRYCFIAISLMVLFFFVFAFFLILIPCDVAFTGWPSLGVIHGS